MMGSPLTFFGKIRLIVSALANFLDKHTIAITNVMLAALTFGGEELLELHFFRCPSSQPFARNYALSYTLGIACTLWLFGIAVYNVTWKICHGCVCWQDISKQCCALIFSVFLKTLFVPFVWCSACLWDGDYLACGFSATPGNQSSTDYLKWKTVSQFYGFLSLPVFLGVMILFTAIYRCSINQSYMLHRYISVYKESEENAVRENMSLSAGKLSKNVVTSFFNHNDLKEEDWEKASVFFLGKKKAKTSDLYYSPLHKCVLEKKWLVNDASTQTLEEEPPEDSTQQHIDATAQVETSYNTQQFVFMDESVA